MLNALRASTKLGPGAKNVLGQQPVFVFAAVCVIDEGLFKIFPISTEMFDLGVLWECSFSGFAPLQYNLYYCNYKLDSGQ